MKRDTIDFLGALLWNADRPDDDVRPFMGKTVYDFSGEFVEAAERFIGAFRAWLGEHGYADEVIDGGERPFGTNVYWSLSGEGIGFFDDRTSEVAELHDMIQSWAVDSEQFEELYYNLEVREDGKIDLSILPEHIEAWRKRFFRIPEEPPNEGCVRNRILRDAASGTYIDAHVSPVTGKHTLAFAKSEPAATKMTVAEAMAVKVVLSMIDGKECGLEIVEVVTQKGPQLPEGGSK